MVTLFNLSVLLDHEQRSLYNKNLNKTKFMCHETKFMFHETKFMFHELLGSCINFT